MISNREFLHHVLEFWEPLTYNLSLWAVDPFGVRQVWTLITPNRDESAASCFHGFYWWIGHWCCMRTDRIFVSNCKYSRHFGYVGDQKLEALTAGKNKSPVNRIFHRPKSGNSIVIFVTPVWFMLHPFDCEFGRRLSLTRAQSQCFITVKRSIIEFWTYSCTYTVFYCILVPIALLVSRSAHFSELEKNRRMLCSLSMTSVGNRVKIRAVSKRYQQSPGWFSSFVNTTCASHPWPKCSWQLYAGEAETHPADVIRTLSAVIYNNVRNKIL